MYNIVMAYCFYMMEINEQMKTLRTKLAQFAYYANYKKIKS